MECAGARALTTWLAHISPALQTIDLAVISYNKMFKNGYTKFYFGFSVVNKNNHVLVEKTNEPHLTDVCSGRVFVSTVCLILKFIKSPDYYCDIWYPFTLKRFYFSMIQHCVVNSLLLLIVNTERAYGGAMPTHHNFIFNLLHKKTGSPLR